MHGVHKYFTHRGQLTPEAVSRIHLRSRGFRGHVGSKLIVQLEMDRKVNESSEELKQEVVVVVVNMRYKEI